MAKDVFVRIKGDNQLSPVLKQIGGDSKTAAAGLKDFDQSASQAGDAAEQSAASMESMKTATRDVAEGVGVLVGGLALAGASYRDQQIALSTLGRAYGDNADQMRDFANQIQDTTNFSNDAAVQAANDAATLIRNYGFTADEVQRVLQISTDLAATSGKGLEDTTYRVVAALRGEAEAAEALGLTMNQQSIDRQNLTLSMSNEEAAHFRLNALYQQAAFAQGAAAEQADTFYGSIVDVTHGLQDQIQTFGGMLGPLGQLGAFASDNAIKIGLMGIAFKQLFQAGQGLQTIVTDMGGVRASATALAGVIGPGGALIAAAVAAEGAFLILKKVFDVDLESGVEHASKNFDQLIQKIIQLKETAGLTAGQEDMIPVIRQANELIQQQEEMLQATKTAIDDITPAQQQFFDQNADGKVEIYEYTQGIANLNKTLEENKGKVEALNALAPYTDEALNANGEGALAYQEGIAAVTGAIIAGTMSQEEAIDAANNLEQAYYDTALATDNLTGSQVNMGDMTVTIGGQVKELTNIYSNAGPGILAYAEANTIAAQETQAASEAFDAQIASLTSNTEGFLDAGGNFTEWVNDDLATAMVQMGAASTQIRLFGEELAGLSGVKSFGAEFKFDANFGDVLGKFDIGAVRDRIISALDDIATPTEALDNATRVIIQNTDAIASNAQQLDDWAANFVDASEGVSRLDSILDTNNTLTSAATINQEQYNDAIDAFTTIGQESAEIQQDVAVIQAKQAPVLADLMEQTENYVQSIAEMNGLQQTSALGFMDSAESAQALQLKMLALDAAAGKLGASGKEWTSTIIQGAAEADPVLKAMLIDMGLISVGADGTITVNFDDQATDPIMKLTEAVEKLAYTEILIAVGIDDPEKANDYFEELFGHAAEWDETTTTADADVSTEHALDGFETVTSAAADWDRTTSTAEIEVDTSNSDDGFNRSQGRAAEWDGTTATADINANDNATDTLIRALALANAFANAGATATFTANFVSTGDATARQLFGAQTGGVIHRATGGSIPFIGGEAGFELVKRAGGGTAVLPERGVYMGNPGDMVFNNEASKSMVQSGALGGVNVSVNISGDVIGESGFAERMAGQIAEGVTVALARRRQGMER